MRFSSRTHDESRQAARRRIEANNYDRRLYRGDSLPAGAVKALLVISMPEPTAIPEFFASMLGVGYIVWRERSKRR